MCCIIFFDIDQGYMRNESAKYHLALSGKQYNRPDSPPDHRILPPPSETFSSPYFAFYINDYISLFYIPIGGDFHPPATTHPANSQVLTLYSRLVRAYVRQSSQQQKNVESKIKEDKSGSIKKRVKRCYKKKKNVKEKENIH